MKKILKSFLLSLLFLGILQSNVTAGEEEQTAFIERFYQNILDRSSDEGGMNTWLNTIQTESATKVALGFLNSQEFINKNLSNEEFVDILYQTLFDRQSDLDGRDAWLEKLNNGRSKQSVMFGFFNSQEFKNLTDRFGVTQILETDKPSYEGVESYVDRFYNLVLKREPEEAGFDDWVKQLTEKTKSPIEIASGFLFSQEYQNQNEDNSTFLDTCYKAFFGRDADNAGKTDWLNKINNQNYTRQQIFEGFTGSQEFVNLVNSFDLDNLDNDAPIITSNLNFTVNENQTSAFTITATDNSTITYSLSGIDASLFNSDPTTGVVSFKINPDYETKNSYSLTVRAMDSFNNVSSKDVTVNIADVVEDNTSLTTFQSGDTWKGFTYNVVTSPITGKQWLDRSLGASQACTSSTDTACYGDYYQWGRLSDGHEKANSATTLIKATDVANAGDKFIIGGSTSAWFDYSLVDFTWINVITNLLSAQWNKTDGTGVCPVGFRVPTKSEFEIETTEYLSEANYSTGAVRVRNYISAFQNFLKLPYSGHRQYSDGRILYDYTFFWTNTYQDPFGIMILRYGGGAAYFTNSDNAMPIRCIQGN